MKIFSCEINEKEEFALKAIVSNPTQNCGLIYPGICDHCPLENMGCDSSLEDAKGILSIAKVVK